MLPLFCYSLKCFHRLSYITVADNVAEERCYGHMPLFGVQREQRRQRLRNQRRESMLRILWE